MAEYKFKQVIVMANWLNMRKGKMVAQGAHAAMMVALCPQHQELVAAWVLDGMAKICVRADSKDELFFLRDIAKQRRIPAFIITDAGHTEFHGVPTETALAIGPAPVEQVDAITGHLKLL